MDRRQRQTAVERVAQAHASLHVDDDQAAVVAEVREQDEAEVPVLPAGPFAQTPLVEAEEEVRRSEDDSCDLCCSRHRLTSLSETDAATTTL